MSPEKIFCEGCKGVLVEKAGLESEATASRGLNWTIALSFTFIIFTILLIRYF